MSLLINGMDMPKNCLLCPCCAGEGTGMGRQHYCQAIGDEPCVSEDYRPENCPLSEIPTPHGRLIDADALSLWDIDVANYPSNYIKRAPTIIEAEE